METLLCAPCCPLPPSTVGVPFWDSERGSHSHPWPVARRAWHSEAIAGHLPGVQAAPGFSSCTLQPPVPSWAARLSPALLRAFESVRSSWAFPGQAPPPHCQDQTDTSEKQGGRTCVSGAPSPSEPVQTPFSTWPQAPSTQLRDRKDSQGQRVSAHGVPSGDRHGSKPAGPDARPPASDASCSCWDCLCHCACVSHPHRTMPSVSSLTAAAHAHVRREGSA